MRKHLLFLFWFLQCYVAWPQADTIQKIIPGRRNNPEQQQKPYVILISIDGFRYDYAEKYSAKSILTLSKKGIKAVSMIPSYPTLTFPNHYSIVTGLYPSHHGIVNNYFYDPAWKKFYAMNDSKAVKDGSWYGGIPLWVLAEQQQMLTASFYWVGSEADIQNTLPTYYYAYNRNISIDRRIQIVKDWLNLPTDRRPHFISFYMPEVDHAGHDYGPGSSKTKAAVQWVDSVIGKLSKAVASTGLPVNFIIVSDHGMTKVNTNIPVRMPAAIDTSKFVIPRGFELVSLYAKNKNDIKTTYDKLVKDGKNYKAYLKDGLPSYLHYNQKDDAANRIGDILLVPKWPLVFNFSEKKSNPGAHGFDPRLVKDMHAIFYAWGPAFKTGIVVPSFENVNIYPVITKILGLQYSHTIDGTQELADKIVK